MSSNKQEHKNNAVALKAVDLFSGCGGLTLGLRQAGFKVIGAVDNDPLSIETYKANHPEVEVWSRDIRDLGVSSVKRKLKLRTGELDLLAGCPPCQGFSTMRTLNGARSVRDPRNDLLMEFLRFAEELRPKTVMMENVPGLAADHRFKTFLKRMRALGYVGTYRVLDAADYGVPQRRRRLIYVAGLSNPPDFAKPSKRRKSVRGAIGELCPPGRSGDPVHDVPERRSRKILELIKKIPKNGGSRTDLDNEDQLMCHKECDGFSDVYGRMAWDEPAPTITSGCFNPSKGRFLHPVQHRAITLREAALLQGFPKRYRFPTAHKKEATAMLIGNALPPEFIRRHASAIKRSSLAQ
jgi:DNA (cytosine-5)-methyltransferase 1